MLFPRRRRPDGAEVGEEFARGMREMEEHYYRFAVWANSYISLLEKRLHDCENDRCRQCEHCNGKRDEADGEEQV